MQSADSTNKINPVNPEFLFDAPYVSTYYFDPRPNYNKDVIIPIYVTDTDNSEYLLEDDSKRFDVTTFKQIIPGLIYAAANATLVLSNMVNGVAIGYTMAQLCLVIETLLGFAILKEHKHKTPAELKHSIAGAIFITAGCIMVGLVGYV